MGDIASRVAKAPEFTKSERLDLRKDPRFDESWLERLVCANPEVLGLGRATVVSKQKRKKDGSARLDVVLKSEAGDTFFVVELMLGPLDSSHIVRTIQYWLGVRKGMKRPEVECKAVLIAESITESRYGEVVKFLSERMPLIVKEVTALQIGGQMTVHFTTIFRSEDEEVADEPDERADLSDETSWREKSPRTIEVARALLPILKQVDSSISLNYPKQYISLRVGNRSEVFVSFRPHKGGVRVKFKLDDIAAWKKKIDSARMEIIPTERPHEIRFLVAAQQIGTHKNLFLKICKASYDYWFNES